MTSDSTASFLSDNEPFMNERQKEYFRQKLSAWKEEILRESRDTLASLQTENENHPDLADRASSETDRAIELRARDRQRKLTSKIDAALARLEDGFRRDSFSYLLFLRLLPVFPFWLVNIVSGLFGVRLDRFVLATIIGITPGALVYAGVGAGFGMLFDRGEAPDLQAIFNWHVLGPLLGLAVLSLVPALYNHMRARR